MPEENKVEVPDIIKKIHEFKKLRGCSIMMATVEVLKLKIKEGGKK